MATMFRRRRTASPSIPAHAQGWTDLNRPRRRPPRYSEADNIAHAMLLLTCLGFALGMALGRYGWPL